MTRAQLLTHWTGTGQPDDHYRPRIADDFALLSWQDVCGTPAINIPPAPNILVIEAAMPDAVYAAIEADPGYGPDAILWSETF